ncbi:unnamed protein product [Mytilus coruscus]|uniref:Uncharacterized protein n=1 Tax=Mytilus coruscus TaxID=42192 RepID=A0A6J8DB55_MYTCO|nr:unnamed protein product [Mytilus coruscus]
MRTNFGRHMAIVMTKFNDFYYVNLYNNNQRNSWPGKCSLGWDEFLDLVNTKECLKQLFQQFQKKMLSCLGGVMITLGSGTVNVGCVWIPEKPEGSPCFSLRHQLTESSLTRLNKQNQLSALELKKVNGVDMLFPTHEDISVNVTLVTPSKLNIGPGHSKKLAESQKKMLEQTPTFPSNDTLSIVSYLRSTGENAICPGHQGHCSANLKPWDSIGNEKLYGKLLTDQITKDEQPLVIGQLTTDGDSHTYRGFIKTYNEVVNLTPENLRDLRHLASTQLRTIDEADFSEFMFPGRTKADRVKIHRILSLDLTNRCTVEYNFAVKESVGKLDRLVNNPKLCSRL